jgi:adenylate kinase
MKERLKQEDCQTRGWLLDGFPRTQAQARALEVEGINADCFIFLNVPDEVLVERVVGRRTDPTTGKIYHLKFNPPPLEDADLLARLVHRSDDTEEKVKVRLQQFHANVEAVRGSYSDISVVVDGNRDKDYVSQSVFAAIEAKLASTAAAMA